MDPAGGDHVVGKGHPGEEPVSGGLNGGRIVDLVLGPQGQESREVPPLHGPGRHRPGTVELQGLLEGALPVEGDVGLVLEDRPVDATSGAPVFRVRLGGTGPVLEEGIGGPGALAEETVNGSMPVVGPRLQGDVHGGAVVVSPGGRVVVGDLDLLDRLGRGRRLGLLGSTENGAHVVDAVQGETHGVALASMEIEPGGDGPPGLIPLPAAARRARSAGGHDQQMARIALGHGQGLDLLGLDQVAEGGVRRLQQRRLRLDCDLLGDFSHDQGEIHGRVISSPQINCLGRRLESRKRSRHVVRTGGQKIDTIQTRIIGDRRKFDTGGGVRGGHVHAGNHASRVVHHSAIETRACALAPQWRCRQRDQEQAHEEDSPLPHYLKPPKTEIRTPSTGDASLPISAAF